MSARVIDLTGENHVLTITRDISRWKKVEEEKKKLEGQLQRAQKMEAIGTLAGGVAHDLNNILSGIVSYPDLLLMDLPDDSPLVQPLTTIQKSGVKAAAIVQDLLTLARRGLFQTLFQSRFQGRQAPVQVGYLGRQFGPDHHRASGQPGI